MRNIQRSSALLFILLILSGCDLNCKTEWKHASSSKCRTNGDLRGGKGILATSRKPSSRATEVVSLGEEKSKTDGETSKKRAKAKEKHKESKKHKDDRATEAERERSLGATEGCVPQSDTKKEEKKEKKDKKAKNPMDKKDKIERKRLKKERKEKRKSERKGTEKARGKKERKREKIEKEKERKKAKSGTEKAVENDTDALDPLDPSSHLEAKALAPCLAGQSGRNKVFTTVFTDKTT